MPGTGTWNLASLWRALGIKNPEPQVRETIQPVLIAGDFSKLNPQHRPPGGVWGGDRPSASGRFSFAEITCRAPGGMFILSMQAGQSANFGTRAEVAGVVVNPSWEFGREPVRAVVQQGTDAAALLNSAVTPALTANVPFVPIEGMFLKQGETLFIANPTATQSLTNWHFLAVEVPGAEVAEQ